MDIGVRCQWPLRFCSAKVPWIDDGRDWGLGRDESCWSGGVIPAPPLTFGVASVDTHLMRDFLVGGPAASVVHAPASSTCSGRPPLRFARLPACPLLAQVGPTHHQPACIRSSSPPVPPPGRAVPSNGNRGRRQSQFVICDLHVMRACHCGLTSIGFSERLGGRHAR